MKQPLITISIATPHTTVICLRREDKKNALNYALLQEFHTTLTNLEKTTIRALVLCSMGKVFCSGLDLAEAADTELGGSSAQLLAAIFEMLATAPFVTIAAAQGATYGGGGGLLLACDIAILAEEATIAFPEIHRGLIPAQVLALMRRKLTGTAIRRLLLTGRCCSAKEALHLGLVSSIVTSDQLMPAALEIAADVAKAAPMALKITKELISSDFQQLHNELAEGALLHKQLLSTSKEVQEGIAAFLEKRLPHY